MKTATKRFWFFEQVPKFMNHEVGTFCRMVPYVKNILKDKEYLLKIRVYVITLIIA